MDVAASSKLPGHLILYQPAICPQVRAEMPTSCCYGCGLDMSASLPAQPLLPLTDFAEKSPVHLLFLSRSLQWVGREIVCRIRLYHDRKHKNHWDSGQYIKGFDRS